MALFNVKAKDKNKTLNLAGGMAYEQAAKIHLASMLITSFAQDQFYRSAKQTYDQLYHLIDYVDPLFAAKAAIYARTEMGMRSITHVLASELAKYATGQTWAKDFYKAIVKRPDDMLEITAYYKGTKRKNLPNAMKKGFAKAFDSFDGYQLAKYRGERKAVKLVDLVNLTRPIPTTRNAKALAALVKGELRSKDTWETKLTKAGQTATTKKEKATLKSEAWATLLRNNRLGYFALLRNLRNIAEQSPVSLALAVSQLQEANRIKKSLVLPFRFLTAMETIRTSDLSIEQKRMIQEALAVALDISLDNVPTFDGDTLIVLDDSGSMTSARLGKIAPIKIGAIFAAVLFKKNKADLMRFSNEASYLNPYHGDAIMTIAQGLIDKAYSGGTNFHDIFKKANKPYQRVIILSDMQGWMGHHTPTKEWKAYKEKYQVTPYLYSFDLQGYGSLQFPEKDIFALAGFSEKVFDIMKLLEQDRNALVERIEQVVF